jgi:hypothetical protein
VLAYYERPKKRERQRDAREWWNGAKVRCGGQLRSKRGEVLT